MNMFSGCRLIFIIHVLKCSDENLDKEGEKNNNWETLHQWFSLFWLFQVWSWCSRCIPRITSFSLDDGNKQHRQRLWQLRPWTEEEEKPKILHFNELCIARHLLFSLTRESNVNYGADMLSSIIHSPISSWRCFQLSQRLFNFPFLPNALVSC